MSANYFKRPDDTLVVELDFAEFIAEHPGAVITYALRSDLGVVVDTVLEGAGRFTLTVTGGTAGRAYRFGIEATADDGSSEVQMCTLRLREPPTWEGIPIVGEVGGDTTFILLVDVDGNALVDASGNALVLAG